MEAPAELAREQENRAGERFAFANSARFSLDETRPIC